MTQEFSEKFLEAANYYAPRLKDRHGERGVDPGVVMEAFGKNHQALILLWEKKEQKRQDGKKTLIISLSVLTAGIGFLISSQINKTSLPMAIAGLFLTVVGAIFSATGSIDLAGIGSKMEEFNESILEQIQEKVDRHYSPANTPAPSEEPPPPHP